MITLRELCESLKVSRRTVQGYEKEGLVMATDKNKYGHLLYDEKAKDRIEKIKFYQQLGFSRKEIKEIIDATSIVLRKALENRVKELENDKKGLEELVEKVYQLIQQINSEY